MIKVTVTYPERDGMRFDMDYYRDRHLPMIARLLGDTLRRYEIDRGLRGMDAGSAPMHRAAVHMYFDSVDGFLEAFNPHAQAIVGDVPNYTDASPAIQISEIVVAR